MTLSSLDTCIGLEYVLKFMRWEKIHEMAEANASEGLFSISICMRTAHPKRYLGHEVSGSVLYGRPSGHLANAQYICVDGVYLRTRGLVLKDIRVKGRSEVTVDPINAY